MVETNKDFYVNLETLELSYYMKTKMEIIDYGRILLMCSRGKSVLLICNQSLLNWARRLAWKN